jgi:transcriptional regulator
MLLSAIVAVEMTVETVEGAFKLNQHKSDADHSAVASALARQDDPSAQAIAQRMIAMRPHLDYEIVGPNPEGPGPVSELLVAAK